MSEPAAPLDARVLTVLRELPSGDVVRLPVADPTLASLGGRALTLEELSTFLGEHLSTLPPAALARFLSPPGAELITVQVELGRDDLPRRLAIQTPVMVRAVVIPAGEARWVFVPKLGHVIYVAEGEELEATLQGEIARLVGADDPTPEEWLSLLPAPRESLEVLTIPLQRKDRGPRGRSAALHRQLVEATKDREALEVLRSVGLELSPKAEDRAQAPVLVGRDAELATLSALLSGTARQSILLVGRERVGKSALVFGWLASERKAGRARGVFTTSGAQLIAGMSALGQWQERLRRVLEAAERLDVVLVFEDLGDLFGDNSGAGHVDLPGTLRPWLQESRVRIVAELTPEALALFEPRDVGFFGNFARLRVEPLDAAATRRALTLRAERFGAIEPGGVDAVMDLVDRYQPYQPLPGKAVALYEEVSARAAERHDAQGQRRPIGAEDVLEAFSVSSGIPVFLLREDRALYRDRVTELFRRRLIGQEEAIRRVIDTICVVKAGLQPTGKPLATFLFVGPTGVGKTELARTLAEFLFGTAERLSRFDMSEFGDALAAERLFRGTQGSEGLLTRQIRQQPFSVLLLDEIEKAHPAVFDLLLQVTGEGRLTDGRGRTAYFHNTIVIMTSNLGAAHRKATVGIGASETTDEAYYQREVERTFRPELVNRLDRVITFAPLSAAEVEQVAQIAIGRVALRRGFVEGQVELVLSDLARAHLAQVGYSPAYGARALRRALEDSLVAPAARLLMRAEGQRRLVVTTLEEAHKKSAGPWLEHQGLRLQLLTTTAVASHGIQAAVRELSALRSAATRARTLDAVSQVSESIETLVSQLARISQAKDGRLGDDVAELQRSHHRLTALWTAADTPYQELIAAEELAMSAFLASYGAGTARDVAETLALARRASTDFRRATALLLMADRASATYLALRVRELDDGRPLLTWLDLFLAGAEARKWSVVIHVGGDRKDGSPPGSRHFGPARWPQEARDKVAATAGPREVLLLVRGPWCAGLLSLEAGLHRFTGWASAPTHLMLQVVAERHEFTDAEWGTLLGFAPPDAKADHNKRPAARHLLARQDELLLPGTSLPCKGDGSTYWRDLELVAYELLTRAAREEEDES
jgi:ATP-dependent Clp protease ATP-binding subunit ClpC